MRTGQAFKSQKPWPAVTTLFWGCQVQPSMYVAVTVAVAVGGRVRVQGSAKERQSGEFEQSFFSMQQKHSWLWHKYNSSLKILQLV